MKAGNPLALVFHIQPLDPRRILRRDTYRASIGVASPGLDATQGKHHSTCRIAHICAKRHGTEDVKSRDDFRRRNDADVVAHADAP